MNNKLIIIISFGLTLMFGYYVGAASERTRISKWIKTDGATLMKCMDKNINYQWENQELRRELDACKIKLDMPDSCVSVCQEEWEKYGC